MSLEVQVEDLVHPLDDHADSGSAPLAGLRLAVVEDDAELRALLVSDLEEQGAEVAGLDSAASLYRHLTGARCDIVILDVMLPGENGYSIAAHLRSSSAVGIVMLTGRGAPRDMAHGLGQGADLYLVKPFDPEVLVAGLLSLRRRLTTPAEDAADTAAGAWSLQSGGWRLRAPDGTTLELSAIERAFLQPLFATPEQPVDRETLIAGLTDSPWDFDPHRLEVLVHRLRARVRSASGQALPLRAIRGAGYLLVAEPD